MTGADLLKKNTLRISKAHPACNYYLSPGGMIWSEVLELVIWLNKQENSSFLLKHTSARDLHL